MAEVAFLFNDLDASKSGTWAWLRLARGVVAWWDLAILPMLADEM